MRGTFMSKSTPRSARRKSQKPSLENARSISSWRQILLLIAAVTLVGVIITLKLKVSADTSPAANISAFGTPVTQNFDTLVSTGTGTLSANTPAGWGFSESGTSANTIYTAGTGSSNTGDTYSFGSTAVPGDRALGQLRSGTNISILGGTFQNNTGGAITSLAVSDEGRVVLDGRVLDDRATRCARARRSPPGRRGVPELRPLPPSLRPRERRLRAQEPRCPEG